MEILIKQGTSKIAGIHNADAIPRVREKISVRSFVYVVDEIIWHMDDPKAWVEVRVKQL